MAFGVEVWLRFGFERVEALRLLLGSLTIQVASTAGGVHRDVCWGQRLTLMPHPSNIARGFLCSQRPKSTPQALHSKPLRSPLCCQRPRVVCACQAVQLAVEARMLGFRVWDFEFRVVGRDMGCEDCSESRTSSSWKHWLKIGA